MRVGTGAVAVALLAVGVTACGGASDPDEAGAAVAAADSAFEAAAARGEDLDEIASYLAEDAVMIPPNEPPVRGRDAIRRYMAEGYRTPGFSVGWERLDVRVAPSGDVAYVMLANRFSAEDEEGEIVRFRGRGVTVWERGDGGEWRVVIYVWNEARPASARRIRLESS